MKSRRIVLAVLGVALLSGTALFASYSWRVHAAKAQTPPVVSLIPSVIPATGIRLNEGAGIDLMPVTTAEQSGLSISSADQAISAARGTDNTNMPATAVLAKVTLIGTLPIPGTTPPPGVTYQPVQDRPAWVVTFTLPEPIDAANLFTPPGKTEPAWLVTHYNVIVDAVSGDSLRGFYSQ
jgi:hypothetical protein